MSLAPQIMPENTAAGSDLAAIILSLFNIGNFRREGSLIVI